MNDKIFAITGLSSGIGAETAKLLMRRGAKVIGFDRNAPDYAVLAFHRVDMSDPQSINAALADVAFPLDGLCNIAGLPPTADKAAVLKVNFFGLRHFTEQAINHLKDGSPIVNVASLAGFAWRSNMDVVKAGMATSFADADAWIADQPVEGAPSYHLSKELVIAWTVMNCQRWKTRRLRMNSVSPGPVSTPILADFVQTLGKRVEDDLKINRAATPREIAPVIAFMCSDDACWMNGTDVAVDAGAGAAAWQEILA